MNPTLKYYFTFFFCSLLLLGYSQEENPYRYYELIDEAEMASTRADYHISDSLFQDAFSEQQNGFAEDYIEAAKNAIKLSDNQKVVFYLKEGFKNGLVFKQVQEYEKDLYQYLKDHSILKQLKKFYRPARKKYLESLNQTLRDEIEKMVKEDQKYRKWWYERKSWKDQQVLLKRVDDKNFNKMLEICEQYGFPDRFLVGDEDKVGWIDVPLLLRHMDSTQLKAIEPFVMKSITNKGFDPYHYVSALDYSVMFKTSYDDVNEKGDRVLVIQQQYGTMLGSENGERIILPVKELENINEARKRFGLESIENYATKEGCEIPREGFFKRTFSED
jgi:hypothetical protein